MRSPSVVGRGVKGALRGVRGCSQCGRIGGADREVWGSLDPDRVQSVGLTAVDVRRRLRGTNIDLAGGRAGLGGTLNATGLLGSTAADCSIATTDYCLTSSANTATAMEVTFLNVKSSWTSTVGVIAVQIRG